MEKVCAICGISESQAKLSRAIDGREVVIACPKCIEMEELIVIKRPTDEQLSYANKPYTVRERLARAMGANEVKKTETVKIQPPSLYCISPYRKTELPIKLVENFHWKIMMARKKRKMSQELLAQKIGEQLIVVKTLESGCITRDSEKIIKKIEDVLGLNLRTESAQTPVQVTSQNSLGQNKQQDEGKVLVTRNNIRTLKVGDLIKVRDEIKARKSQPEMPKAEESEEEEVIDIEEGKE